jgi:hypothetical protein
MTSVWFKDPSILFKNSEIFKFWPTSNQTIEERINASTRFILYASNILYIIRRDPRIFVLAAMVIGVMYVLYKPHANKESHHEVVAALPPPHLQSATPDCQAPTAVNPMANFMLTDYTEDPDRPSACYYPSVQNKVKTLLDNTIPYGNERSRSALPKYQQRAAARQFVSMPVTTAANDQTGFAEACYGKKNGPMCKDGSPGVCNPNARGVQLEAFAGIDMSGGPRTGMFGGTV